MNANYFGPQDEGLSYLSPFIALNPVQSSIAMVPWTEVISTSYFGFDSRACAPGQHVNVYSMGLKQTEVSTFETFLANLLDFSNQQQDIHAVFVIHRWPTQAVLEVPDRETAYPHRQLKMHVYVKPIHTEIHVLLNLFPH